MKLRFTIRDLFWLTLVVALAVGWWFDHRGAWQERFTIRRWNGAWIITDNREGYYWEKVGASWQFREPPEVAQQSPVQATH
jgi:hypothetical protein